MSYWLTKDQESRIRVYIYQNRLRDAAEFYQASNGCSEEEAANFIESYIADLRVSSGFAIKAFFFRLLKAISLAIPNGLVCALAGIVWASAFGKSLLQFGIWAFCVSGMMIAILSPAIKNREGAFAVGALFSGLGFLAITLGVIVGIVRRLFF